MRIITEEEYGNLQKNEEMLGAVGAYLHGKSIVFEDRKYAHVTITVNYLKRMIERYEELVRIEEMRKAVKEYDDRESTYEQGG